MRTSIGCARAIPSRSGESAIADENRRRLTPEVHDFAHLYPVTTSPAEHANRPAACELKRAQFRRVTDLVMLAALAAAASETTYQAGASAIGTHLNALTPQFDSHSRSEQNRNIVSRRWEQLVKSDIASLRESIAAIEGQRRSAAGVLPFGLSSVDGRLPGGGLAIGALHEVAGGGNGAVDGAAAALFVAGVAARIQGRVLWCLTRPDLFAPAIAQAGLSPDRVIYVEAGEEKSVLACVEEGLRHGGLGCVVAEVAHLSMTASRRLQLAAEGSGTMGIALRRWRRQAEASDFGQPTAASTRWRVSVLPSAPLPVPGVGRHRWLVELIRARAGDSADFVLEACDDQGRLGLPAEVGHRSPQTGIGRRYASG